MERHSLTREIEPVVLIVEDEPELANLYAEFLDGACQVRIAETGDEALALIDHDLDIALLDRRLGDWRGEELVNVIRERRVDCGIVMVTAVVPDFDIVDLPVDDYLTKPISMEDLQHTTEEVLHRRLVVPDLQEYLALTSRRIVLEDRFDEDDLLGNLEYSKLLRRLELAEDQLELNIDSEPSKHRPDTCPGCDLRWDISVSTVVGYVKIGTRVWKCTRCGHVENVSDPNNRFVIR